MYNKIYIYMCAFYVHNNKIQRKGKGTRGVKEHVYKRG